MMNANLLLLASATEHHSFAWWNLAGYDEKTLPHYLIMGPIVCLVLCLGAVITRWSLASGDPLIPKDPGTMGIKDWVAALYEGVTSTILDLLDSLMPHHHEGRKYMWLIAPIFMYLLVGNLMALVPGFAAPTDSINTNFAVAITVFVFYNTAGFWAVGPSYLKHFWAPSGLGLMALAVGPLLAFIELFGHAFRPITLSMRLLGNMTGDHAAFSKFLTLVPLGVPIIFMLMGLLVSVVQAYVFTLLTSVYITLATSHDH